MVEKEVQQNDIAYSQVYTYTVRVHYTVQASVCVCVCVSLDVEIYDVCKMWSPTRPRAAVTQQCVSRSVGRETNVPRGARGLGEINTFIAQPPRVIIEHADWPTERTNGHMRSRRRTSLMRPSLLHVTAATPRHACTRRSSATLPTLHTHVASYRLRQ